jgi:hypothetical protein
MKQYVQKHYVAINRKKAVNSQVKHFFAEHTVHTFFEFH